MLLNYIRTQHNITQQTIVQHMHDDDDEDDDDDDDDNNNTKYVRITKPILL